MKSSLKAALIVVAVVVGVGILWFSSRATHKVASLRHSMTGVVVSVNPAGHTADIHNDRIPGFMEAMDMEYRIKDAAVLANLKPGDKITATMVSDGQNSWKLENIVVTHP